MKKLFVFLALAFAFQPTVFANQDDVISANEIYDLQEYVNVRGVKSAEVVEAPTLAFANPTVIRVLVEGTDACGDAHLVFEKESPKGGTVLFAQIGKSPWHIQPGCTRTYEYLWAPRDYDMPVDSSKTLQLRILSEPNKAAGFLIAAKLTRRRGQFPNKKGFGNYYEYSDVRVFVNAKKQTGQK